MIFVRLHPSRVIQAVRSLTAVALRSVSHAVEGQAPESVPPPFWQQERAELLVQLAQRDARIAQLEVEATTLRERVAKLEELLRTHSKDSSLPASQDRPDRKPPRTEGGRLPDGQKRNQGGQKGHPGRTREPFKAERVDRIVTASCSAPCNLWPVGHS